MVLVLLQQMEIKQKLEDNERSLADNRKRLAHWTDKHASLELHELDDGGDQANDEKEDKDAEDAPLELVEYPEEELAAIDTESIKAEIVVFEGKSKNVVQRDTKLVADLRMFSLHRTPFEGPCQLVHSRRVPQA